MKVPVMHDDQHGTAIISAAALLSALARAKIEFCCKWCRAATIARGYILH
jgi:hypothetical protein